MAVRNQMKFSIFHPAGRVRPLAGYLQVPMALWVSFALVLNGTIWLINR